MTTKTTKTTKTQTRGSVFCDICETTIQGTARAATRRGWIVAEDEPGAVDRHGLCPTCGNDDPGSTPGSGALKTQTVAGHRLTLHAGIQYWASRPMAHRGMTVFPVTIAPVGRGDVPTVTIPKLSYDAANALINAFNNEPDNSWAGRVW